MTAVLVFTALSFEWTPNAMAQGSGQTPFDGAFAGVDVGRQQVIGGSLVDGVDTLQEDARVVTSLFAGWRKQIRGFVVGGELGIGMTDGDLTLREPARGVTVDYRNDGQWHWGLAAGHTVRSRTLAFVYVSEVTRHFDVTIQTPIENLAQQDEQGLLRFGAGVEIVLTRLLRLRMSAGTSRADFGGRPTNIEIGRRLEVSAGVVVGF